MTDQVETEVVQDNPLLAIIPEGKLSVPEYRDWISAIECKMNEHSESIDRHDCEESGFGLGHTFTQGLYTREIVMPPGAIVVSRIHLFEHPFIISKGKVSVYDGEDMVTFEAPYKGVTKAGTKRILYVHEETIWTTFHVTDKKTFEEIDVDGVLTCGEFEDFERLAHKEITL